MESWYSDIYWWKSAQSPKQSTPSHLSMKNNYVFSERVDESVSSK